MTWTLKVRGAGGPMLAEYECPAHGRFDATVDRDENGDPPETSECPHEPAIQDDVHNAHGSLVFMRRCRYPAPWVASAVAGRVKVGEVDKGKVMDYPPANVCLDTRALADGMPYSEWRATQDKVTRDINLKRARERKNVLR